MRVYTQRVQTVLTAQQYALLRQLSKEQKKPVSVLVREAVEQVYFKQAVLRRRRTALKSLLSLNAPVSDWEQMEEEIIKGVLDE
ncbi:MAG: ribbon-helix-helix domain-containing protein [Anaerolineae bacterium]|nr:ribbon-helix-helix domain-containing protein [Anaerolineae bacterium]